jgi:hypothetical protein
VEYFGFPVLDSGRVGHRETRPASPLRAMITVFTAGPLACPLKHKECHYRSKEDIFEIVNYVVLKK